MTRSMSRLLSAASLSLGIIGPSLAAAAVYPGCSVPPPATAPSGNVHYVDPVHGTNSGDGTLAHPWHTLTEVVAAGLFYNTPVHGSPHINPNAPIQAGDTVYLLSGAHGPVTFQGWYGKTLVGYNNSSFITIAALPGQTPVLSKLTVMGGSKWAFHGLTIKSLNNSGNYLAGGSGNTDYWLASFRGPHSDIVFDSNILTSTPDVSQWTILDWMTKRASGISDTGGTCMAITNNSLRYVGVGVASQTSDKVLISGNKINYFADDGIDYGSSDMIMSYNTITNSVEDGDGIHRDGMQGQPYNEQTTLNNIQIKNNTIIRIADPRLPYPGYLQGIDAFDGLWTNMTISDNVIITDADQGISFYGVTGASVVGNTLLGDSGRVLPCSNVTFTHCETLSVVTDTTTVPRIVITAAKAGAPSKNVVVMDNVTTGMGVDLSTASPNVQDNTCVLTGVKCVIGIPVNGKMLWAGTPGSYGNHNVISSKTAKQMFVQFDTGTIQYNLAHKQ